MTSLRRLVKFWAYGSAGRFTYYDTRVYFPRWAPVFRALCEQGRFEPEIIDRLIALAAPHTTVFDVGANIGLMAIPVLRRVADCRVVSFEPSPNSVPYLRATSRESDFGDRWMVVEKALAGATGELPFCVGRPNDALFEGLRSGDRVADARMLTVPVSTIDTEWRALGSPPVSVIKIDVEGAEGQVLDGAGELLRAQRPALLIEWHEPYLRRFGTAPDQLLTIARANGYRVFTVPAGVSVDDASALQVQMMACQNFLLVAGARA